MPYRTNFNVPTQVPHQSCFNDNTFKQQSGLCPHVIVDQLRMASYLPTNKAVRLIQGRLFLIDFLWRAKTRYKCDDLRLRRPHAIMT